MFKIAVELGVFTHMLAAVHDIDDDTMIKLCAMCTDEFKRINGIINFENAVADPANTQNLLAKYTNKDDGIHPYNGYQVMANAIDLNLFQ